MNNIYATTRIWSKTLTKLRLLAAARNITIVRLLDELADAALDGVDLERLGRDIPKQEIEHDAR
jgi:predicted DNA-binding ribbon-helix-helix protein